MVWLVIMIVLMIPLVSILLDSPFAKALAGRIESRGISGGDTVTQERLAYLESEVERLARELDEVSEGTRFVQQLLADRAGDDGDATPRREALPSGDGDS